MAPTEVRQRRLRGKEDALDVHREHRVPGRLVRVDRRAVALDAGRGHNGVEPAEALDGSRNGRPDRMAIRHVCWNGQRGPA